MGRHFLFFKSYNNVTLAGGLAIIIPTNIYYTAEVTPFLQKSVEHIDNDELKLIILYF